MNQREIVKGLIEDHNDSIDAYINETLPRKLRREGYEVVEGKISPETWFAAQRLVAEAHFTIRRMRYAPRFGRLAMTSNTTCSPTN